MQGWKEIGFGVFVGLRMSGKLAFLIVRGGKSGLGVGVKMQEGNRGRDAKKFIV